MTSIIILTYNNLGYTKTCIESVREYTKGDYEIVVVDNGSKDGMPEWLEGERTKGRIQKLFLSPVNLGVPAGWNKGLEMAGSDRDYYVVLNNDVFVTPGWLEKLITVANYHPLIGMVGPVTNYCSGPQREGFVKAGCTYCWRLVGFCLLIKGDVLRKVGLFDERFGRGNFEDDDYCLRVIEAGYENVICGDCFVHHIGSASWEPGSLDAQLEKNKKIFDEKWPMDKIKKLIG